MIVPSRVGAFMYAAKPKGFSLVFLLICVLSFEFIRCQAAKGRVRSDFVVMRSPCLDQRARFVR